VSSRIVLDSVIDFRRSGAIKTRAEALHQTLYSTMHGKEFNLLAHSMVSVMPRREELT
jgi:hypothetical protein